VVSGQWSVVSGQFVGDRGGCPYEVLLPPGHTSYPFRHSHQRNGNFGYTRPWGISSIDVTHREQDSKAGKFRVLLARKVYETRRS